MHLFASGLGDGGAGLLMLFMFLAFCFVAVSGTLGAAMQSRDLAGLATGAALAVAAALAPFAALEASAASVLSPEEVADRAENPREYEGGGAFRGLLFFWAWPTAAAVLSWRRLRGGARRGNAACFTLEGDFDPAPLSSALRLVPTVCEPRGVYSHRICRAPVRSRWTLRTRLPSDRPLEEHVRDLLQQLEAADPAALRQAIRAHDGGVELYFRGGAASDGRLLSRSVQVDLARLGLWVENAP